MTEKSITKSREIPAKIHLIYMLSYFYILMVIQGAYRFLNFANFLEIARNIDFIHSAMLFNILF